MEKLYKQRITDIIKMKTKKERVSIVMAFAVALVASMILNKMAGDALKLEDFSNLDHFTLLDGNISNAVRLSTNTVA